MSTIAERHEKRVAKIPTGAEAIRARHEARVGYNNAKSLYPTRVETGTLAGVWNSVKTGIESGKRSLTTAGYYAGIVDRDSWLEYMAASRSRTQSIPVSRAKQAWEETGSLVDLAAQHPVLAFELGTQLFTESMTAYAMTGIPLSAGGAAAGAAIGGATPIPIIDEAALALAGMGAGSGIGSAMLEYESTFGDILARHIIERGGDPTDPEEWKREYENDISRENAHAEAMLRAQIIGGFDAVTAMIPIPVGKIGSSFARTKGLALHAGIGATGGAGGEAAAQFTLEGEIVSADSVLAEALLEVGPAGSRTAIAASISRAYKDISRLSGEQTFMVNLPRNYQQIEENVLLNDRDSSAQDVMEDAGAESLSFDESPDADTLASEYGSARRARMTPGQIDRQAHGDLLETEALPFRVAVLENELRNYTPITIEDGKTDYDAREEYRALSSEHERFDDQFIIPLVSQGAISRQTAHLLRIITSSSNMLAFSKAKGGLIDQANMAHGPGLNRQQILLHDDGSLERRYEILIQPYGRVSSFGTSFEMMEHESLTLVLHELMHTAFTELSNDSHERRVASQVYNTLVKSGEIKNFLRDRAGIENESELTYISSSLEEFFAEYGARTLMRQKLGQPEMDSIVRRMSRLVLKYVRALNEIYGDQMDIMPLLDAAVEIGAGFSPQYQTGLEHSDRIELTRQQKVIAQALGTKSLLRPSLYDEPLKAELETEELRALEQLLSYQRRDVPSNLKINRGVLDTADITGGQEVSGTPESIAHLIVYDIPTAIQKEKEAARFEGEADAEVAILNSLRNKLVEALAGRGREVHQDQQTGRVGIISTTESRMIHRDDDSEDFDLDDIEGFDGFENMREDEVDAPGSIIDSDIISDQEADELFANLIRDAEEQGDTTLASQFRDMASDSENTRPREKPDPVQDTGQTAPQKKSTASHLRKSRKGKQSKKVKTLSSNEKRMERQIRRLNEKIAAIRTDEKNKKRVVEGLRTQLRREINEIWPANAVPKPILTAFNSIKITNRNPKREFARALGKVYQALNKYVHNELKSIMDDRLKALSNAEPTMSGSTREDAQLVLDTYHSKKLSEKQRRKLEGLRDAIGRGERVPLKREKEIARLRHIPTGDLDSTQLRQQIERIDLLLMADRLKKRLRTRQSQRLAVRHADQIAAEIRTYAKDIPKDRLQRTKHKSMLGSIAQFFIDLTLHSTPDTMVEVISGSDSSQAHTILFQRVEDGQVNQIRGVRHFDDAITKEMADNEIGMEDLVRMSPAHAATVSWIQQGMIEMGYATEQAPKESATQTIPIRVTMGGTEVDIPATLAQQMTLVAMMKDRKTYDLVVFENTPIELVGQRPPSVLKGKGEINSGAFTLTFDQYEQIRMRVESDPKARALVSFFVAYMNTTGKVVMNTWSMQRLGYNIAESDIWMSRPRRLTSEAGRDFIVGDQMNPEALSIAAAANQGIIGSKTAESHRIVKERVGGVANAIQVHDFFEYMNNLVQTMYGIAHMGEPIRTASMVISSEQMRRAVNSTKSARPVSQLEKVYSKLVQQYTGNGDRGGHGILDRLATKSARLFAIGTLGLNPRVVAYQPVSLFNAQNELIVTGDERGKQHWREGIKFFLRNYRTLFRSAEFQDAYNEMIRHSPYAGWARMNGSAMTLVHEGGAAMGAPLTVGRESATGKTAGQKADWYMAMIRWSDTAAIVSTWVMAKAKARDGDHLPGTRQFWEEAERHHRRIVTRTQPTYDPLHITGLALEARDHGLPRLLTLFRAQRSKNVDMTVRTEVRAKRGQITPKVRRGHHARVWIMAPIAIMAIKEMFKLLAAQLPIDDDDELLDDAGAKLLDFLDTSASSFVGGSAVVSVLRRALTGRGFSPDTSPVLGLVEDTLERDLVTVMSELFDLVQPGKDNEFEMGKFLKASINTGTDIAVGFGVPIRFAQDLHRRLDRVLHR